MNEIGLHQSIFIIIRQLVPIEVLYVYISKFQISKFS